MKTLLGVWGDYLDACRAKVNAEASYEAAFGDSDTPQDDAEHLGDWSICCDNFVWVQLGRVHSSVDAVEVRVGKITGVTRDDNFDFEYGIGLIVDVGGVSYPISCRVGVPPSRREAARKVGVSTVMLYVSWSCDLDYQSLPTIPGLTDRVLGELHTERVRLFQEAEVLLKRTSHRLTRTGT